jgi:dolichyl-phosphate-mannose-protein mannosyltransferase
MTQDYDQPFRKTVLPLFLCGLSFGIGAACKWTSIYGGPGLLLLYIIHQVLRGRYYSNRFEGRRFIAYLIKTLLVSIVFFIVVPFIVYYLSYIPYGTARGLAVSDGMLWDKKYFDIFKNNQIFMFTYHQGVKESHPYASPWWKWVFNIRPILYYLEYYNDNIMKSAFGAFGNPIVWWGGLVGLAAMVIDFIRKRSARALFILIGYLSQLVPWMFITRPLFIYHYFPSTIFLVLAISSMFDTILDRKIGRYKLAVAGFTASSVVAFAAFYPVLTGIAVPQWYTTNFLRWTAYWPF